MYRPSYEPAQDYSVADIMVCVMARLIRDKETVFHGVSSHMPLVSILLAKQMHAPDAVHLNIPGGVNPEDLKIQDCSSACGALCVGCESIFPLQDVFDLSMRGRLDVAFLSGIQFDVDGNINASVIGDYNRPKVRMPGGAGSAVLIPTAKRALIWRTKHDTRTFVEKVDFITTRGNVDRIVTPMCVFKFEQGRLRLESVHPFVTFETVQENTGFALSREGVVTTMPPTVDEMRALHSIDPDNYRNIEF
jgi:glutaconate CoA-transferase subunit B